MRYVEAPNVIPPTDRSLFLGGGITDCPDWQAEICDKIKSLDIAVYNPRRANFPIHDPNAAEAQITWEHDRLRESGAVLFWFCKATMCPIVLFELGSALERKAPVFVGVEPGYQRTQDVEIQTKLERPDVKVVDSIDALAEQVLQHFGGSVKASEDIPRPEGQKHLGLFKVSVRGGWAVMDATSVPARNRYGGYGEKIHADILCGENIVKLPFEYMNPVVTGQGHIPGIRVMLLGHKWSGLKKEPVTPAELTGMLGSPMTTDALHEHIRGKTTLAQAVRAYADRIQNLGGEK